LQAEALWALGHSEEAFDLSQQLSKQEVNTESSPQLHNLRAVIFVSMGKSEEAIRNLRTVLAHDKNNARATSLYTQLREFLECKAVADMHYKSRRYDEALEQYQVAMKSCPSPAYMAKLYFNRACTHASLGRHDLAIQDCNESIRLNDEYIKAYMRRAASLRLLMNNKEEERLTLAIRNYEVAMTLCKTKQQRREIVKKLKDTKLELEECRRIEQGLRMKMQRRHTAPMAVTPDCSPDQWRSRKQAMMALSMPNLTRTRTEDSTESMSISKSRSRASSASSWRSRSSSPAPLYVADEQ
jgi:tetratricopeptide (TPR) repeat protein